MSRNILIVDDDSIVQFIHQKLIQKIHPNEVVQSFLNTKDALDFILKSTNESMKYLVFLDINLLPFNAWEWIELLRENQVASQVEIILISSSVDSEDMDKAAQFSEIKGFVSKPLRVENLEHLKADQNLRYFL
jgi:response regulator of citrate/malate metabolism